MRPRDLWKIGVKNIFASPLRSLLTVLGIAIGIGAILAVFTLGDAGRNQVRQEMGRLGIDRVWLTAAEGESLRQGDGTLVAEKLGVRASEQVYLPMEFRCGTQTCEGIAVACSRDYLELGSAQLLQGRWLSGAEWRGGSQWVMLGEGLAKKLSAGPGWIVTFLGRGWRVAGIVRLDTETSQVDTTQCLFMPLAAFGQLAGLDIQEIILAAPSSVMPETVAKQSTRLLEIERGVHVSAMTMQAQIEAADSVVTVFVDVLRWVALICILVGGIGVMNILLVSVRERRREIGVMKALGTTSVTICSLFLLEALIYAVVGGVFGVGIGMWIIAVAGSSIGLYTTVKAADCLWVVMAALGVGLIFGVLPAMRASSLSPVEALRDE